MLGKVESGGGPSVKKGVLNLFLSISIRVRPQDEKSSNLHITADSTGSIHKYARGKKFDPKKVRLGCGDLI